jgi:putative membrane protein
MEIPKWLKPQTNKAGAEQIRRAVVEVEKRTSGEIVPMIVYSSSPRGHVPWILFFALFALIAITIQSLNSFFPPGRESALEIANIVVSLIGAFLFSRLQLFQRLCTPKHDLESAALMRAHLEFYEMNLQKTTGRTGVLIFVSLIERFAVVLADEGISRHCSPETWEQAINELLGGIGRGDFAGGMVAAIKICGEILSQRFPRLSDDKDELPNRLVIKL